MSKSYREAYKPSAATLDRPGTRVPSVDRAWDDIADLSLRLKARKGDRASHRAHHSLYEDMLN